jgi:MFS family permease
MSMAAAPNEEDVPENRHSTRNTFEVRPGHLYFALFVWISTTGGRFLAPFLEHEADLNAESIGVCLALQSVVSLIVSPFGGSWADSFERRNPGTGRVLVMALGVFIGSMCCLLHSIHYLVSLSFFTSHLWHFGLQVVFAAVSTLTIPVLDGTTLQFLEEHPDLTKDDYGKERLYGAVGWAVVHMVMAPLLDWFGFLIVYPLVVLSTCGALVTLYLYVRPITSQEGHASQRIKKRASDIETSGPQSKQVPSDAPRIPMTVLFRLLAGSLYGCTFLVALFTLSQGQAVVDNLVFIFFEYLGSSYTVMGVTVQLTVLFEIPIFRIAPSLLARYGSGVLLLVACACYIIRVIGYSYIPKGHMMYVMLLEPLHGVTYACSQTASVDTAARSMPQGYEATGQSFMYLIRGLGSCIGLWLGGRAMDHLGPRLMYRASSAVALVGSLVFAVVAYNQSGPSQAGELIPQTDDDDDDGDHSLDISDRLSSPSVELQDLSRIVGTPA